MNAGSLLLLAAEVSGPDAKIGQKVATIVVIGALVLILAAYLVKIGGLLEHIRDGLGEVSGMVVEIIGHAEPIIPGVERINRTLGVIAGALPLLYNLAEKIDNKLTKA
jgi:hypothetical protein